MTMTSDEAYEVIREALEEHAGQLRLKARGRTYAGPAYKSARATLRALASECDELMRMNPGQLGTVLRGDLG